MENTLITFFVNCLTQRIPPLQFVVFMSVIDDWGAKMRAFVQKKKGGTRPLEGCEEAQDLWKGERRHRDISMITALTCQNLIVEWNSSKGVEQRFRVEGGRGWKKRWNQKRETITQSLTGRKSTDLPSRQMYQIASRTFCLLLCHVCAPATSSYGLYAVCCLLSRNTRTYVFSQNHVSCLHFPTLTRHSTDIAFRIYFILLAESNLNLHPLKMVFHTRTEVLELLECWSSKSPVQWFSNHTTIAHCIKVIFPEKWRFSVASLEQ